MLGELLSVCRRIFGLRPNFLKHSQNSHFDCNDPALIHSSTVHQKNQSPKSGLIEEPTDQSCILLAVLINLIFRKKCLVNFGQN